MTEIIGAVWSDADPEFVSAQQVERLVARLRQLLGDGAREIIPVRKHDRYRLDSSSGRVWVDSLEFDRLARAAQVNLEAADVDGARRLALQALALWRSDPVVLADVWSDLKQRRCKVRLIAAEAAMRNGDPRQAATELAAFLEDYPDDERGWNCWSKPILAAGSTSSQRRHARKRPADSRSTPVSDQRLRSSAGR